MQDQENKGKDNGNPNKEKDPPIGQEMADEEVPVSTLPGTCNLVPAEGEKAFF